MGAVLVAHKDEQQRANQVRMQASPGQHQLSKQQWSDVCRRMKMSVREQRVCQLLFDGLTRQKISELMDVSNRTVRHHMERIHVKLGVSNRVGVVLQIIQLRDLLGPAPLISSQVKPSPNEKILAPEKRTQQTEA